MSSPISKFLNLRRFNVPFITRRQKPGNLSSTVERPPISPSDTPLYELKSPNLLVRLSWPLLMADLVWTLGGCELVWNRWTTQPTTAGPATQAELRPAWQRMSLILVQLTCGGTAAMLIFAVASRSVRRLYVLMPEAAAAKSASKRTTTRGRVFIQCFNHLGLRGKEYSIADCSLESFKRSSDLMLKVKNHKRKAQFHLSAEGSVIKGHAAPPGVVRKEIMSLFGLKHGGWKSGPIFN